MISYLTGVKGKIMRIIILLFFCAGLCACNANHLWVDDFHEDREHAFYCQQIIQGEHRQVIQGRRVLSNSCQSKNTGVQLANRNKTVLDEKYPEEREYLNGNSPKLGLALSGGGTRAASFSIGVLKGLKESGILDQVEIISSVSGGSYASYWYLSKLFYQSQMNTENAYGYEFFRDTTDKALNGKTAACKKKGNSLNPADCYRFQYTLENSSKILSLSKKPGLWSSIKNGGEVVSEVSMQVLSMPLHWIMNGLFDWEVNITPYRRFYQNGLERTYGYMPLDASLENFKNDQSLVFFPRVYATQISFKELRDDFLNKQKNSTFKPPLFVINTTGRYARLLGGRSHDDQRKLEKEVFEFTPWRCGSLMFGYQNIEECGNLSWSKVITISGAAVDGQYSKLDDNGVRLETEISDKLLGGALNIINGDLGYHIDNYKANTFDIVMHKVLPFPLFALHDWYLSNSYVGEDRSSSIYLNDGGASENLALFSLIQRGVERIIVVDAEHDPNSSFQAAKFVKNTLATYGLKFTLHQQNGFNVYDATPKEAVIKGTIEGWVDRAGNPKDIELIYIKLAVQAKHSQSHAKAVAYPYSVMYFRDNNESFPHNSTADVSYDSAQYRAYRDLGHTLAKEVGCHNKTVDIASNLRGRRDKECY